MVRARMPYPPVPSSGDADGKKEDDERRSNLEPRLCEIVEGYLEQLKNAVVGNKRGPAAGFGRSAAQGPSVRDLRKLIVFVLTDGAWKKNSDPRGVLNRLGEVLNGLERPADQVGIQFVQYGNDAEGTRRLNALASGVGMSR